MKTILMDTFFDNMLFRLGEEFMIVDKSIVRNGDPSFQEDSIDRLLEVCEHAIQHIEEGETSLQFKLGEERAALQRHYLALHASKQEDKVAAKLELNAQLVKYKASPYYTRFREVNAVLVQLATDLKALKTSYEDRREELKKQLPATVTSDASSSSHTMEQVQEMQQIQMQQQQIQTQTAGSVSLSGEPPSNYGYFKIDSLFEIKDENDLIATKAVVQAFEGIEGVYLSPEAKKLLELVNGDPTGHPLFRLLIIKPDVDTPARVCLISKNDYQHRCFPDLFDKRNEKDLIAAVYSVDTSSKESLREKEEKPGHTVGLHFVQAAKRVPDFEADKDLIKKVAIAKFRMGFAAYTTQEEAALVEWLATVQDEHPEWIEQAKGKAVYV